MNRRKFVTALVPGSVLSSGCVDLAARARDNPGQLDLIQEYKYEGRELAVRFRDGAEIEKVVLFNRTTDETYATIDHPPGSARFTVLFPDRLASYLSRSLYVKVKTADGWDRQWVWEPVHGTVKNAHIRSDGRASFDIENTGHAPLLVRFIGVYGDVPNSTVDLQSDSFNRTTFERGPGVVGIGRNRPLQSMRTDLVISPGETAPFETIYAPFALRKGGDGGYCNGRERTAQIGILHASGKIASYSLQYRADGDLVSVRGDTAGTDEEIKICEGVDIA